MSGITFRVATLVLLGTAALTVCGCSTDVGEGACGIVDQDNETSFLQVASVVSKGKTSERPPSSSRWTASRLSPRAAPGASAHEVPAKSVPGLLELVRGVSYFVAQRSRSQTSGLTVMVIFVFLIIAGAGFAYVYSNRSGLGSTGPAQTSRRSLGGLSVESRSPTAAMASWPLSRSPLPSQTRLKGSPSEPAAGLPVESGDTDEFSPLMSARSPVASQPRVNVAAVPESAASMFWALPALAFPPLEPQSSLNFQVSGASGQKLFHVNVMRPHKDFAGSKPGSAQEYVALLSADQLEEHLVLTINSPTQTTGPDDCWRGVIFGRHVDLSEIRGSPAPLASGRSFVLKENRGRGEAEILRIRGDPVRHRLVVAGPGGGAAAASVEPDSSSEEIYRVSVQARWVDVPLLVMALLGLDRLVSYIEAAPLQAR